MSLTKENKGNIITQYRIHGSDTGSPEVQIALLSERITYLTEHFKTHKKDHARLIFGKYLQPIKAEITALRSRMLCQCHSICDETTRIAWPTLEYRQTRQIRFGHDLL